MSAIPPPLAPPLFSSPPPQLSSTPTFMVNCDPNTTLEGYWVPALIHNIVTRVAVGCQLDLPEIHARIEGSYYTRSMFESVIVHGARAPYVAFVLRNGFLVCTGACTEQEAQRSAIEFVRSIGDLGYPVRFLDYTLENIVAEVDLDFCINIEALRTDFSNCFSNHPLAAPGILYQMSNPDLALIVFETGQIVVVGARSRDDVCIGMQELFPLLAIYQLPLGTLPLLDAPQP